MSVLTLILPARLIWAQETQFQKGTEQVIEETEKVEDGKKVRTIRSGQPSDRKGGPRVGEIEAGEVDQVQRRRKSLNLSAFGFGPFISSNVGDKAIMYGASMGRHWEVSTVGEIVAEFSGAANGHGGLGNFGLGFNAIPLRDEISPVIGAELGLGFANGRDEDDKKVTRGGFTLQGNLGARMFRLASTQMEIMGTYTAILASPTLYVAGLQIRVLY